MTWITDLQSFLYNELLPLAEPDAQRRIKLIDSESMREWQNAFTDKSYDPNLGFNYEVLEKIGDAAVKLTFNRYLLQLFPDIDQMELSEMTAYYLSKEQLADISKSLRLGDYARTRLPKDTHLYEDILEAVFGALITVGDRAFQVGVGYILIYNLTVGIWNKRKLSLSVATGMPKTQVKEIFEKLRWSKPFEVWNDPVLEIKTPREARQEASLLGKKLPSVLAVAEGDTKVVASGVAYKEALDTLIRNGITQEYASEQRDQMEYGIPEIRSLWPALHKKLESEGFVTAAFTNPRTTATTTYVQLLGIKANHHRTVLATASVKGIRRNHLTEGKVDAIKRYLNGSKSP